MIRPANFRYNAETAENNAYQHKPEGESNATIQKQALSEFDNAVKMLREQDIHVTVIQDSDSPIKPDAIFPNNWFSTHEDNILITYPMWAENRRIERRDDIIEQISEEYVVDRRYSFEYMEDDGMFLEGTGSMILDRMNKVVYACLSARTDIRVLDRFCILMGYEKVTFFATDEEGTEIYHTNVMMGMGETYAFVCLESIKDEKEKSNLVNKLKSTGKHIVELSQKQVNNFAGNMLKVSNKFGEAFLIMSASAASAFSKTQLKELEALNNLIIIPIPTIEKFGGGSIRCMMAEIFLDKK
jgi:hypothetical protein